MNFLSILEVFVFIQNTFVDSAYVEHYYESMGATLYSNGSEVMVQSYEEASEHCQTTGGKILKILNSDQQSVLNNFLNNSKLNVNKNDGVFIGLRRTDFEQNHKLHSILKPEDYVEFKQRRGNNFLFIEDDKLNLMIGNKPNRFLCSKSAGCPNEQKCYEIVESEKTWYDARSYCLQKGEDLFTFNGKFDASKLKINRDKAYWLGYSKISWYWEDEPDVFTKFTNWIGNSETTFYGDEKKCSAMSIDDVSWRTVSCTSAAKDHYVICMKANAAASLGSLVFDRNSPPHECLFPGRKTRAGQEPNYLQSLHQKLYQKLTQKLTRKITKTRKPNSKKTEEKNFPKYLYVNSHEQPFTLKYTHYTLAILFT
ncbi:hypothetical protein HELRODRAFT_183623 [Helobdella robusta]|uniref:C-type lectin domain-containing protein n=1 Tax=Helobdella robusta TaxID=6412 RepID=T1FJY3_HELRO|nr:hypothetical protein HELRODRAFT_183623 [Helobdella robusta]ESO10466.1 hypothetical protein HELRODRAFT_183623 [Helobdella robusta]